MARRRRRLTGCCMLISSRSKCSTALCHSGSLSYHLLLWLAQHSDAQHSGILSMSTIVASLISVASCTAGSMLRVRIRAHCKLEAGLQCGRLRHHRVAGYCHRGTHRGVFCAERYAQSICRQCLLKHVPMLLHAQSICCQCLSIVC